MRGDTSWGRRRVLKLTGISAAGMTTFSQTAAAGEEEADVSVTFNDQESDGTSVVIESLYTEVEAEVIIFHSEGDRRRYKVLDVEGKTEFTDRTVELDEPIPETQLISVSIQPPEGGYSYGGARATIAVGESIDEVGPTIELIEANSDAGFHYPYYLYIPEEPAENERPLFVQGNNSPSSEDEYDVHLEQAERSIDRLGRNLAEPFQSPALVPAFPRYRNEPVRWDVYVQTLNDKALQTDYPELERVDRQLLNMIDDAKDRLAADGYEIAEKIHLHGFSASATFSNRFTILHPEMVNTVTSGGNGATTLPESELDGQTLLYPAGVADLEELTGSSFDKDTWRDVDQFLFVGEEDQPLPEDDTRSYKGFGSLADERQELMIDVFGVNRVTERFPTTRTLYHEAGASAAFRIYEGVGHRITPEIYEDLRDFHRTHMNAQDVKFDFSVRKSADEVQIGDPVTVSVTVRSRIDNEATATATLAANGTEIETAEVQVGANETETVELETTFDETGEYAVSMNGMTVGDPVVVTEQTSEPETDDTDDSSSSDAEPSESSESDVDDSTVEDQSGFGVIQAIAGLGGLSYVLKKYVSDNEK